MLDKNPIEEAFEVSDISSAEMQTAVELWNDLYREPYTNNSDCDYNPHMATAATLVSKLDSAMFSEYSATIAEGDENNNPMATMLENLNRINSKCMQRAMVGGECLVKPVPSMLRGNFSFTVLPRENYSVLGRDEYGVITDVGSFDIQTIGNKFYTLAERRTVDAQGYLTIQNKLFESDRPEALGEEVSLKSVEQFAMLESEAKYKKPIYSVGLLQAKMPLVNMIDGSDAGISIYAPAAHTIKEINEHQAMYKVEFRNARSRIIASEDFVTKDRRGNNALADDLFIMLNEAPNDMPLTIFSPEIREESYRKRENTLLRIVENQIGLKRGMLSDVNFYQTDKTATEVNLSNAEFSLTILGLQEVWTQVVMQAFAVCGILGDIYFTGWNAKATPMIDYGDGVLYDRNRAFQEMYQLVTSGILRPEVLLAWYNNIKWDSVDEKIMADIQAMMPNMQGLTNLGRGAL